MLDERRSACRVRTYLPVRLKMVGAPQLVETLTKDLSVGGFRCLSPVASPVSADVYIELMLGAGSESVELRGKTAWFGAIPQSEQFDVGIAFAEVPPETQRRLSSYLARFSDQRIPA